MKSDKFCIGLLFASKINKTKLSTILTQAGYEVIMLSVKSLSTAPLSELDAIIVEESLAKKHKTKLMALKKIQPDAELPIFITTSSANNEKQFTDSDFDGTLNFPPDLNELRMKLSALKRKRREEILTSKFAELGARLAAAATPREVGIALLDLADELIGWDASFLDYYSAEENKVYAVVNFDQINGERKEFTIPYADPEPSKEFLDALKTGKQLILRRRDIAPGKTNLMAFGDTSRKSASLMFVPVRHGNKTVGWLSIQSYTYEAYDQNDLELLQRIADYGGGALERAFVQADILRQREERLQLLLQSLPAIMWTMDTEQRLTSIYGTGVTATGLNAHQCLGRKLSEIFQIPEDNLFPTASPRKNFSGESPHFEMKCAGRIFKAYLAPLYDAEKRLTGYIGIAHDITERKQIEDELTKIKMAVEQSPDSVMITNKFDIIEYVNPAFEKLTGYTRDEVIGKTPDILRSGKHNDEFYAKILETVSSGKIFTGKIIDRNKNGEIFYQEICVTPLRDAKGNITHFVNTGKDITEQQRAEKLQQALTGMGTKLISATNPRDFALAILETADDLIGWDSASFGIYSLADNMVHTLVLFDTVDGKHQECPPAEERAPLSPVFQRVLTEGPQLILRRSPEESLAEGFVTFGTGKKSLSIMIVPLKTKEENLGVLSIHSYTPEAYSKKDLELLQTLADYASGALARIFSEQRSRQREERFRLLTQNARDIIYRYEFKPRRGFSFVSPSVTKITGYTPEEYYADPDLGLKIVHPEDRHLLENIIGRGILEEKTITLRWIRKDGSTIWTEQNNVPIYDDAGNLVAIEGIARDITERKREEDERYALARMATRLSAITSLEDLVNIVCEESDHLLHWDAHYLAIRRPQEQIFKVISAVDTINGEKVFLPPAQWQTADFSTAVQPVLKGFPVLINRQPGEQQPGLDRFGDENRPSASLIKVPVRSGNNVIGVLSVQSYTPFKYNEDDVEILQRMADILAPTLERIFVTDELRRQIEYNSTLHKAARIALDVDTPEALARQLLSLLSEVMPVDAFSFIDYNPATEELVEILQADIIDGEFKVWATNITHSLKNNPLINLLTRKKPVIELRRPGVDIITYLVPFGNTQRRSASLLFAPILYHGETKGVITVQSYKYYAYNHTHAELLADIANIAGIALSKMKAEENLRQSEAKLRFLFEESQALNILIAPDGTIKDINKSVTSILGYDKSEVLGKSALDFVVPEQREMVSNILTEALSGKDTPALEIDVIARDGVKTLFFSEGHVLLIEKGEIAGVLFTAVDITEQKRAVDKLKSVHKIYQQAIENAGGVPYLYNYRTNEYDYISDACEQLFGIPAKDLTHVKFLQLIQENIITEPGAPSDPYKYRDAFGSKIANHYKADIRIITPSGKEKWLSDFAVPIFDEQTGEVIASLGILQDITARKRAEEELKQIHSIYRSAIENAQGVPYRFKYEDTTYEFIGEGCEELLGIPPRELTFQKFRELVKEIIVTDPEGLSDPTEYITAFRTGQLKHFRVDYRIVTPQGIEKWLSDCALLISDEKTGRVIGALGILQDITLRKRAEQEREALQRLSQRLTVSLTIQELGKIIAEESRKLFKHDAFLLDLFNESTNRLTGIYYEDTPYGATQPQPVPVDLDHEFIPWMRDVMAGNAKLLNREPDVPITPPAPFGFEDRPSMSLMFVPVRWEEHTLGVLSVQSYTPYRYGEHELKLLQAFANLCGGALVRVKAEEALLAEKERLTVTLRSIGDGVIVTDADGKIILMNKVAEELTKWTEAEALGRPLTEVLHLVNEKTRSEIENPLTKVFTLGEVVDLPEEALLVARDATEYVITDSAAPIRDKNSKIIGAVLVFRDITEKRKLEEEVLKVKKLESLGILAGGIAHDFNNLLTGIIGNLSLARLSLASKDYAELDEILTSAEKAALRTKDLTQQLLTFARGGVPIKKTTDLRGLIKETAIFALRGSRSKCQFSIPDDLWSVDVDVGQFHQVINNIIINADQAMPEGGTIIVSCENVVLGKDAPVPLVPGKYVKIAIKDSGVGIAPEHLPKIFDPYFTTKQKGCGLGLATSYSIIKRHGGYISAESTLGKGSTFYIYLPASAHQLKSETEQIKTSEEKSLFIKGRALLMDDDEIVRRVARNILSSLGLEVEVVNDGEAAIHRYQQAKMEDKPFDVVILDLTVPGGMGGKETLQKLKEIDPAVKAIVSSGYSTDPVMSNYKDYGFIDVVPKPYRLRELREALIKALKAPSGKS